METNKSIQKNNPFFFEITKNIINSNKVSHAFLLSGPRSIDLKKEGIFLCQALKDGAVNKEGVHIEKYVDFHIVDGSKGIIKKNEITNSISMLQEMALDDTGKKILLINNIENANVQSMNSLLKFLEEPTTNTFIVMTTNNSASVLPTIKSRSQIISIRSRSTEQIKNELIDSGYEEHVATLLCLFTKSVSDAKKIDLNNINKVKKELTNYFANSLVNSGGIFTSLESKLTKSNSEVYLKLILEFFNNIWKKEVGIETIFDEEILEKYSLAKFNYQRALLLTSDFLKGIKNNSNFGLSKNLYLIELARLYV